MYTLEDIIERIHTDDAFVCREAEKILYLYTLKRTIRYGQARSEHDYTESVAEHIYGMHILTDYFLPLEYPDNSLDQAKIALLITWHELGEIETGDIPNVRKTEADRMKEAELIPHILEKTPTHMQSLVRSIVTEYEDQKTPESRFVKAVDKIEPLIHSLHPLGKETQHHLKLTTKDSIRAKEKYLADYPTIARFSDVLHAHMDAEGYFYTPTPDSHSRT